MRTYRYLPNGAVHVDDLGRGLYPLPPRLDLRSHSPDGFRSGYCGSGPSQLALAILCDCLGDDAHALRLYQEFKRAVIAKLPGNDPWEITSHQVMAAVLELELRPSPVASEDCA